MAKRTRKAIEADLEQLREEWKATVVPACHAERQTSEFQRRRAEHFRARVTVTEEWLEARPANIPSMIYLAIHAGLRDWSESAESSEQLAAAYAEREARQ